MKDEAHADSECHERLRHIRALATIMAEMLQERQCELLTANGILTLQDRFGAGTHPQGTDKIKAISEAPIGRFAKTNEIASAVTWLASDEASYMVGAVVVVDGGQTID